MPAPESSPRYSVVAPEQIPDIIHDRYFRARGGTAEILALLCTQCSSMVALYQKDGPGPLIRCYADRVYLPNDLTHPMTPASERPSEVAPLACPSCHTVVATPTIFQKEHRLAFNVIRGTIHKRKLK